MLSSISWSHYFTAILLVLICYYVYVAYKYFHWEILSLIGIKRIDEKSVAIPIAEIKKQFTPSNHANFLPREPLEELNGIFQSFWDEVNAYLAEINPQASKEEICFTIKIILGKYPILGSAEYKTEIETTLSGLLNQYFPEKFIETDIQHLWR